MPGPINGVTIIDGSMDWSGGVNSVLVTTLQSDLNPNGLARNMLAWMDNATVRDGGITPRGGYTELGQIFGSNGFYQGEFLYDPFNFNPYLIVAISGHILQVNITPSFSVIDLSQQFNQFLPPAQDQYFFVQAEQFLVIQAGDNVTLPLIWDGALLRRSKGITNTAVAPGTPGVNEIPAATAMDYFQGRLWYATGRVANAGDMVNGPSGTAAYQQKDSVLNVTENPLVLGGDGFAVSAQAGNIRALFHNGNLNTQLGQGQLFIGTRRYIFSLNVPVTRNDWIGSTNNTQPIMTVVQLVNGPVNDRSVVAVNGDIYYQSLEPAVRSLLSAIRYFNQPGNIEISAQENRIFQFNNRALLRFGFGLEFGSRLFESALPRQVPQGVVHDALLPLDFIPMSTFGSNNIPIWEGNNEGLAMFQGASGDFGGQQRAFLTCLSPADSTIRLFEMTEFEKFDTTRAVPDGARIDWYFETPAFTWGDPFLFKKLVSAELWIDRLFGTAVIFVQYRVDGETCWIDWHKFKICSAKNSVEDCRNPITYPIQPFGEGYRATMTLPKPPIRCESANHRPSDQGFQFQLRINVKGYCRFRGILLYAEQLDRKLYQNLVCGQTFEAP